MRGLGIPKASAPPSFNPISLPKIISGRTDATEYETCSDAWNDMIYWMALLYGDWYGNKGSNTVSYAYWSFLFSKAPAWIKICLIN
jgi:hypothetical protein